MEFIELLKERDLADIEDLTNLIYCYNHLNKTKEAVECCNDILKLDPNNIEIYISLTMLMKKKET